MKLIFTLGNPEERYVSTRHNIGFHIADSLSSDFKLVAKFFASIAETTVNGEKVIIAKPTTYYNEVGRSFIAIKQFYKVNDEDILVIHDELSLPFGTIRTRKGGRDAGNNGIKSINANGGENTNRLRIGVRNQLQGRMPDADFVLGKFTKEEQASISQCILPAVSTCIGSFIEDSFATHSIDTLKESAAD